jgi:MFS family permease
VSIQVARLVVLYEDLKIEATCASAGTVEPAEDLSAGYRRLYFVPRARRNQRTRVSSRFAYTSDEFLMMQLAGIVFFGAAIPISSILARRRRRLLLMWVTVAIGTFGLVMAPLFKAGTGGLLAMTVFGLSLMGVTYGPLGTFLSELFPAHVRYTGSSLTFNLAGTFGASLAPYIATFLARDYGLEYVGYYLAGPQF